ncbi:MAG: hypothetical protein VCA74_08850, partial [Deltaproteobacteria bacterium]
AANGPDDFSSVTRRGFTGSQESVGIADYPDGVYNIVRLKGLVSWNSHAFNLTNQEVWLDAYNNTYYTNNLTFQVRGGLNTSRIFVQHVAPFEEEEYCMTHTFAQGSRVFMITSHTHRHGKRFRYYWGPQTECTGGNIVNADPGCLPGAPADIFYESYNYQDPVYMDFDPPLLFQGTVAERTIKACSLFDNGKANPSEVKRQSTSPAHPATNFGGPCPNTTVACLGGANQGALCYGNDDNCPDSICDACPATGGLTTEDEMFAPSFRYYIDPE